MTTYLLTWNPQEWHWNDLAECVEQCAEHGVYYTDWSCGNTKKILPGDRFFFLKQGAEPKGIMASGLFTSKPDYIPHWNSDKAGYSLNVQIEFDALLNPDEEILSREELSEKVFPDKYWNAAASGFSIPENIAEEIEIIWQKFIKNCLPEKEFVNYWWVNHKQTFKDEIEGGYLWCPQKNKNGARNQTYINLTEAQINDVVFSYADGKIQAVGLVERRFQKEDRPAIFGKVGEQWDKNGWLLPINWTLLDKPLIPKNYLNEIAPLLPERNSPIRTNGNGNQGCYLAAISDQLGQTLIKSIEKNNAEIFNILDDLSSDIEEQIEVEQIEYSNIPATEKEQIVKSRRGQGLFRSRVEAIEKACRLTDVSNKGFLIASHIKPWKDSNNAERLDGNNGLLLSPHVDKLFDKGWISFTDDGEILCTDPEVINLMKAWRLDLEKNVGNFSDRQKVYLNYHREQVHKKP